MPVPGFSVEQDAEVHAYRQLRAQYLAQKRAQKAAERASRKSSSLDGESANWLFRRFFSKSGRKSVSVGGNIVPSWRLEEDSDFESVKGGD